MPEVFDKTIKRCPGYATLAGYAFHPLTCDIGIRVSKTKMSKEKCKNAAYPLTGDSKERRIQVNENKNVVPFGFEDRWARTLSGEEEGAFAWISLNYLNGFFTTDGVEEYGVVETGGASSQVKSLCMKDAKSASI